MAAPVRTVRVGAAEVVLEPRPDASTLLRSPEPLALYPASLTERFAHWAREAPDRVSDRRARTPGASWRQAHVRRGVRAVPRDRPGAARPQAIAGATAGDPLGQRHRAGAARARRHARGHPFLPVSSAYSTRLDRITRSCAMSLGCSRRGWSSPPTAKSFARAVAAAVPADTRWSWPRGRLAGRSTTPFAALDRCVRRMPSIAPMPRSAPTPSRNSC